MKFIVELWLDGYETEDEMKKACVDFIDDQLNFSGSSVTIENYDDLKAKYQKAVEAIKEIDAQNDDRCWYNVEQICHQFLAELGEKE